MSEGSRFTELMNRFSDETELGRYIRSIMRDAYNAGYNDMWERLDTEKRAIQALQDKEAK